MAATIYVNPDKHYQKFGTPPNYYKDYLNNDVRQSNITTPQAFYSYRSSQKLAQQDYSTSEVASRNTNQYKTNPCIVAFLGILCILVLAGAIGVGVLLTLLNTCNNVSPPSVDNQTNFELPDGAVPLQNILTLKDLMYLSELGDPNSLFYKAYMKKICEEFDVALSSTGDTDELLLGCRVLHFSPGSIVADVMLHVNNPENQRDSVVLSTVTDKINNHFQGQTPGLGSVENEIYVNYCAEDDDQCEQLCQDSSNPSQCGCRNGYSLDENGRTCSAVSSTSAPTIPAVSSTSASTTPAVSSTSASATPAVSSTSASTTPAVSSTSASTTPGCATDQFTCGSGRCVPESWICDNEYDCQDRSDEANCTCSDDEFQCGDGRCVPESYICDDYYDCQDRSDEVNCPCSDDEFTCNNTLCVPNQYLCNGNNDCKDFSDEINCPCMKNEFMCDSLPICISEQKFCDDRNDCPDGSDEPSNCKHHVFECAPSEHKCDGKCLSGLYVCDGIPQCTDDSDEMNCTCDEAQCNNGMCLGSRQICDRKPDCSDGSDETDCSSPCDETLHQCDGSCINSALVCDGEYNCVDLSDETNCSCIVARDWLAGDLEAQKNIRPQAQCKLGTCLETSRWCDGHVDCFDSSDEHTGCTKGCPDGYFRCGNDECVPMVYKCDLVPDCSDYTDELDCSCPPDFVNDTNSQPGNLDGVSPEFQGWTQCGNGQCIMQANVCDGETQCLDGSDEQKCNNVTCPPDQFACPKGFCIPSGFVCDGDNDCDDFSDEMQNCDPCSADDPYRRPCANGVCLKVKAFCNGVDDCGDRSDEIGCDTCSLDEFSCPSGQCLNYDFQCNKINDCGDWYDELNCGDCGPDEFQCSGPVPLCLPNKLYCDRNPDCPDESDEQPSCDVFCELFGLFACNGRCFSQDKLCDRDINCGDLSDESQCKCNYYEFPCGNGVCVPIHRWCDGQLDCFDGTDERQDPSCADSCPEGFGKCEDGKCYSPEQLCLGLAPTCENYPLSYNCSDLDLPKINCGVPQNRPAGVSPLIFNGDEATPGSWPWQISLHWSGYRPGHICGGSIIDHFWIVTAAHCLESDTNPNHYSVYVGEHDRRVTDLREKRHSVAKIIIHPSYDTDVWESDIALLQLVEPIQYNEAVQPVCLQRSDVAAGTLCATTGWGNTLGLGDDTKLNQVVIPVVNQSVCRDWFEGINPVTDNMICAGVRDGSKGVCQGDSGGPLVCKDLDVYTLYGLTSWGKDPCNSLKAAGVFTRVSWFIDWILSFTGKLPVVLDDLDQL